jgi:hypothetical protein
MRLIVAQSRHIKKLTGWLLFFLIVGAPTLFAQNSGPAYKGVDSFPLNTGDIAFNAALDDSSFIVCNPKVVFQYYNTGSYYKQHKREIEQYFKSRYQPAVQTGDQTGYLTIRFIINCSGKTGRFRIYELDANYQPYIFDAGISSQLMKLTKELTNWQPAVYKDKIYDSYQYITFKLKKGAIECVLP